MPKRSTPHTIYQTLGGQDFTQRTGCTVTHIAPHGLIFKLPMPLANTATHVSIDLLTEQNYNVYLLRKEVCPMTELRCFKWIHLSELADVISQLICLPHERPDPIQ